MKHIDYRNIYRKKLVIDIDEAEFINNAINHNPKNEEECMGEDETITNTVKFDNGYEMDIKCCGVQYEEGGVNTAWGEAVLYDPEGRQVAMTEPADEYFCDWDFDVRDGEFTDRYIVEVVAEEEEDNEYVIDEYYWEE